MSIIFPQTSPMEWPSVQTSLVTMARARLQNGLGRLASRVCMLCSFSLPIRRPISFSRFRAMKIHLLHAVDSLLHFVRKVLHVATIRDMSILDSRMVFLSLEFVV